jgi:type IX secretion system PorP/SprF family membrane protein
MKKHCTILLLLAFFASILRGQGVDTHISQYWINAARINPALTGVTDNDFRFIALARSQDHATLGASSDYESLLASLDGRLKLSTKKYTNREAKDYLGWGINALKTKAGDLDAKTTQLQASSSFMKRLNDRNWYLATGFSIGYVRQGFDLSRARWGSQGNQDGTSDPNRTPYDKALLLQNGNIGWWDTSVGVSISQASSSNIAKQGKGIGFSVAHLTRPHISILNNPDERAYLRYTFHGAFEKRRKNNFGGNAKALVSLQNKSIEMLLGGNLTFDFGDNAVQVGTWLRLNNGQNKLIGDAVIPVVRFDFSNLSFGFSYDFNIFSNKTSVETLRGLELTFICRGAFNGIKCPDWKGYNFTF